ncbi:MAG: amidophosphoribosyltransferase [Oscillospiraceae bacterium]|nr:amidophosphoribosyltransferase [Oscillospiraceae bacterium]
MFDIDKDKVNDECGVFGIYSKHTGTAVAQQAYLALFALQHRGQESCGIAVCDDGLIRHHCDLGLVPDVFSRDTMESLGSGNISIGHVRYSTMGTNIRANAQPLVIRHIKGAMAIAHNGNLTNAVALRKEIELAGAIFHSSNDTEVISYIITKARLTASSIEEAVETAMGQMQGAYSLVIMSPTKLLAVRDPCGFRPLCMGELDGDIIFASESCALDSLGAKFVRDIEPGEIVVADKDGVRSITTHCKKRKSGLCLFEFIYIARPDSTIDGVSVHSARLRAGALLAKAYPIDADVVIGVPDSGIDAALGYSRQSGLPYGVGFIKNRYIGRTFIQPTQGERELSVRIKLNTIDTTIKGKRVVLIEDSVVRGTTTSWIVNLVRKAGAKEVHMLVASPPYLHPCYFGTDVDNRGTLIAHKMSVDEICRHINADSLHYLSLDDVEKIAEGSMREFCTGCFTGDYPLPVPAAGEKNRFEYRISDVDR